jgi:hypothetical protein
MSHDTIFYLVVVSIELIISISTTFHNTLYIKYLIGDLPVTPEIQHVRTEQLHDTQSMTSLCVMTSFTLLPAIVQGGQDVSGK